MITRLIKATYLTTTRTIVLVTVFLAVLVFPVVVQAQSCPPGTTQIVPNPNFGRIDINDPECNAIPDSLSTPGGFVNNYGAYISVFTGSLTNVNGATLYNIGGIENLQSLTNFGEITSFGVSVSGYSYIQNYNQFTNGFGGRLEMAFNVLDNLNGATLYNYGDIINYDQSVIDNSNGSTINNNNVIVNLSHGLPVFQNTYPAGFINEAGSRFNNFGILDGFGGSYMQTGSTSVTKVDGAMTQTLIKILDGTLGGHGTINTGVIGSGSVISCAVPISAGLCVSGTIYPGDPEKLTVNGSFILDNGKLEIAISGTGPGQSDLLDVIGNAFLVGADTFQFDFIDGFLPQAGDLFNFMNISDGVDVSNLLGLNFLYEGIGPGFETTLLFDPDTGSFTLRADNDAVPVPEPSTLALIMIGLGVLLTVSANRPFYVARYRLGGQSIKMKSY